MPPRFPLSAPVRILPLGGVRTYAVPAAAKVTPTKPPSHRAAETRKTQLHRSYLSLLRSTPLMLLFQHNNLRAVEWAALRRELQAAFLRANANQPDPFADAIKIHIVRGAVFNAAMRVAEYYDPRPEAKEHGTSEEAYRKTIHKRNHPLSTLVTGPVGLITFPQVSPQHLRTVMEIMFPEGRPQKGLDPLAVSGLHKLILLAARVDGHVATKKAGLGEVMASEKVRWVSALPSIEGLQGQIAAILQSVGGGELVRALEAGPISVVRTLDGHRKVLGGELEEGAEKKEEEVKEVKAE